jgi:hypothetical protein
VAFCERGREEPAYIGAAAVAQDRRGSGGGSQATAAEEVMAPRSSEQWQPQRAVGWARRRWVEDVKRKMRQSKNGREEEKESAGFLIHLCSSVSRSSMNISRLRNVCPFGLCSALPAYVPRQSSLSALPPPPLPLPQAATGDRLVRACSSSDKASNRCATISPNSSNRTRPQS